jgi:hypothetical protein
VNDGHQRGPADRQDLDRRQLVPHTAAASRIEHVSKIGQLVLARDRMVAGSRDQLVNQWVDRR